jgi:hypothetical protein
MKAFLFVMSVLCIAGLVLVVYSVIQESKDCAARGGEQVGDGNYYTVVSTVNNVTTVYTYEGVECTK